MNGNFANFRSGYEKGKVFIVKIYIGVMRNLGLCITNFSLLLSLYFNNFEFCLVWRLKIRSLLKII